MTRLTDDQVAATLPGEMRSQVAILAQRDLLEWMYLSPSGRRARDAMRNAAAGWPQDAEQDARWRRLGIHPDQQKSR
jgi:hypothetical protein